MNTIRIYLENMFLGLPQTEDVKRAKEELLIMMEDKYQELRNSGKTENEAIGIVISEFGNLEELADALGIKDAFEHKAEYPLVSYEKAMEYIEESRFTAPKTAMGVWLCIMSPVILLILLGLQESKFIFFREDTVVAIGLFVLFGCVALGVSYFIRFTGKLEKYEYLQENPFSLDYKTEQMVINIQKQEEPTYRAAVSLSVVSYILSALPIIMISLLTKNEGLPILAVAVTLAIVAFATYNIINKSRSLEACKVLLQIEEYAIEKKSNKNLKVVSQVYWALVVAVYLGYSFITGKWYISWVIWPIAGVVFGAVNAIMMR
ncbi:MAG: permease prefix domain 1-containing protein [Tissierellia bacterium]|nr:permease prefix domain 1-containing protein [Tissierellia bacterium]MDD4781808.1 permease prefix domain 1-containing protein [Tissierellia bacterium]